MTTQTGPHTDPMSNEAAKRLLVELQENPLPGARYAYTVVRDRLPMILAIEREAATLDVGRLARADHENKAEWADGCLTGHDTFEEHMAWHRWRIEGLATWYARLTTEEPS